MFEEFTDSLFSGKKGKNNTNNLDMEDDNMSGQFDPKTGNKNDMLKVDDPFDPKIGNQPDLFKVTDPFDPKTGKQPDMFKVENPFTQNDKKDMYDSNTSESVIETPNDIYNNTNMNDDNNILENNKNDMYNINDKDVVIPDENAHSILFNKDEKMNDDDDEMSSNLDSEIVSDDLDMDDQEQNDDSNDRSIY